MAKEKSITYPARFPEQLYNAMLAHCQKEKRSVSSYLNILAESDLKAKGLLKSNS